MNKNDDEIIKATSAWLLLDVKSNKPKRIENLKLDLHINKDKHAIEKKPEKIVSANCEKSYERNVSLTEIDLNKHVNNAKYLNWILDCFEMDFVINNSVKTIQVNFLAEAIYGNKINVNFCFIDENLKRCYIEGENAVDKVKIFQSFVEF